MKRRKRTSTPGSLHAQTLIFLIDKNIKPRTIYFPRRKYRRISLKAWDRKIVLRMQKALNIIKKLINLTSLKMKNKNFFS